MKEELKAAPVAAINAPEDGHAPTFELHDGHINLFSAKDMKGSAAYTFWGRLKTLEGQLKFVRLWEFSSREQMVYYKGYALDTLEDFSGLSAPKSDKDAGYCILFSNPQPGEREGGKKRPHLTGKLYLESETLLLALWQHEGPKGLYYSGSLQLAKVAETETDH